MLSLRDPALVQLHYSDIEQPIGCFDHWLLLMSGNEVVVDSILHPYEEPMLLGYGTSQHTHQSCICAAEISKYCVMFVLTQVGC